MRKPIRALDRKFAIRRYVSNETPIGLLRIFWKGNPLHGRLDRAEADLP